MKLISPVLLVELIEGAAVVGEKVAADPTQEHRQGRVAVVDVDDGKAILGVEEVILVSGDRKSRVAAHRFIGIGGRRKRQRAIETIERIAESEGVPFELRGQGVADAAAHYHRVSYEERSIVGYSNRRQRTVHAEAKVEGEPSVP